MKPTRSNNAVVCLQWARRIMRSKYCFTLFAALFLIYIGVCSRREYKLKYFERVRSKNIIRDQANILKIDQIKKLEESLISIADKHSDFLYIITINKREFDSLKKEMLVFLENAFCI